jgi:hypothetical protein
MKKKESPSGQERVSLHNNNNRELIKVCTRFICPNRLSCPEGMVPDDCEGLL